MTKEQALKKVKTREEAKCEIVREGKSIVAWARENGLQPYTVYDLLNGTNRGLRGQSHKAAVLLGMKDGIVAGEGHGEGHGKVA